MSDWSLGPFRRRPGTVLGSSPELSFDCPASGRRLAWAAKDVFNPAAVVRGDEVVLLVRAEDHEGRYAGTSRIGLATSTDGENFVLEPEPVIFPDDDPWQAWEWPGGCEDPRVVEMPEGGYLCLYSAFNGTRSALSAATSSDLQTWEKHGPVFDGTSLATRYSKSGAVVTEVRDGRLVAARLDGHYWMYWGEGTAFLARSADLVRWEPVDYDADPDRYLSYRPGSGDGASGQWSVGSVGGPRVARPVMFPRRGRFDSLLVEPGPPAVVGPDGIVLIYNGANHPRRGDPQRAPYSYRPAQALMDRADPGSVLARATAPFLDIEEASDRRGQVGDVLFAEGLVLFQDRLLLYMGLADSRIGVAEAAAPDWARR